jgi:RNAse (barnase) inhibitor barstar
MKLAATHLREPRAPWIVRLGGGDPGVAERRLAELDLTVPVLDAGRMRTRDGLFDEFASRLQFPDYFGRNWDSFSELLADLSWLGGAAYAIVVEHAERLLDEEPGQLPQFLDLVDHVAAEWAEPVAQGEPWDRPAVPFHLLLHLDDDGGGDAGASRRQLADLDELVID